MRSRIVATATWLIMLATAAFAQTENALSIPDVTAGWGSEVSLPVMMENTSEIVGVQFRLDVPEGVTILTDRVEKGERLTSHTVSVRETARNQYTFIVLSPANEAIAGYAGTLFTVGMRIGTNLAEGRTYPMTVSEAVMGLYSGENVCQQASAGSITVARSTDFVVRDVTIDQSQTAPGGELSAQWTVSNEGELAATGGWSEQLLLVDGRGEQRLLTTLSCDTLLLQPAASTVRTARIVLQQVLGMDGNCRLRVRLIPHAGSGERNVAQGNNTATSTQAVYVDKQLMIELSAYKIEEDTQQAIVATLVRTGSWQDDQTFLLSLQGDGRLTAPQQVTIPAGQSGNRFEMTVVNNEQLDTDSLFVLTVTGHGYPPVESTLQVVDDELPALSLIASKSEVTEGEKLQLTVGIERALAWPLMVTLTCEHPQRFTYPRQVVIPAGQQKATFEVTVNSDDLPGLDFSSQFIASAARHQQAEAIVMVKDDDMPALTLQLLPQKVQEGAGPVSMTGILRRTGVTTNKITVQLSDDAKGDLYFAASTLTLNAGVEEATFNFGPVDNNRVDGDRIYTVTAAVYISSCSCSAQGQQAGAVSAQLEVLDDDGPALQITSTVSTIREGGKTTLTVSRNTSTAQPLTVTLLSDYDENLSYDHTVTIPAGALSAQVEVTSQSNNQSGDSHTVVFTAQADGYASGTCWVMVTDQTLPDAVITSISVAETEIKAGAGTEVKITIANYGQASLPKGTSVRLYAYGIDNSIGKFATTESMEPEANTTLTVVAAMPDVPGRCYIYAVVNEERAIQELSYGNNNSTYAAIQLLPRLTTNVRTNKTVYRQGEAVIISGTATGVAEGTEVEVYTVCEGIRYAIAVTTDAQGRFDATWQPSEGLMGHTLIGACHPGEGVKTGQTAVEIIGLKRATTGYTTCQTWVDEAYHCTIELQNPDSLAQTFSSVEVVQKPSCCNVDVRRPATIEAGETVSVEFTLLGKAPTEGNDWEEIVVRAMTNEGASIDLTLYYYCRPNQGRLVASESQINTTVTVGTTRLYPVVITNQGKGSTGKISLSLPDVDWLSAVTPAMMSPLEFGDSATIVLRFTATADMELNVPFAGTIGVNCENGSGLPIAFSMEPVSDLTGTLALTVTDEYTYYLEGAPGVADATVTVRHPTTGTIVAQGITSNDGLFTTELPEGYYRIDVEAQKHSSYTNYVLVNPGRELQHEAFISYQAITYSMTVEETEVEDRYEINMKADYETNVPKPVIVISLPEEEPMPGVPFPVVVTNKGLIALNHVNIQAVISSEYSFELLGNTMLDVLEPQQSHMLYAVIRDTTTPPGNPGTTPGEGGGGNWTQDLPGIGDDDYDAWVRWRTKCIIAYLVVEGEYRCGPDWKWHFYPIIEHAYIFDCVDGKTGNGTGGGDWQQPPNVGWNPPGSGKVDASVVLGVAHVATYECNPCLDMLDEPLGDCLFNLGSNLIPFMGGVGAVVSDCTSFTNFSYSSDSYCTRGILGAALSTTKLGLPFSAATCLYDMWDVIKCLRTKPKSRARDSQQNVRDDLDWLYDCHEIMVKEVQATYDFLLEYFGSGLWLDCNVEEVDALMAYITADPERSTFTMGELQHLKPTGMSDNVFSMFVERVNNTNRYALGQMEATGNMANATAIASYWNTIKHCEERAKAMGYATTADLFAVSLPPTQQLVTPSTSNVCAHVRLEIKQTMSLTRPVFMATLEVFNGHDEIAMQNVRLNLTLKTDDDTIATDREFQVNAESLAGFEGELSLDSGWILDAQQTGTATILLVPTKYAALTESKNYTLSGTLNYLDPFSGVEVARPLLPQRLVVSPLPDLELTYLMQRDVYGDDPLTTNVVEPMENAEFALIINNKGYGEAKNVRMLTEQPKIVDNEKGLFINFDIDSTQVNGEPATLSLGQTIANDFGTIGAQSQAYAQWWLRSTLLGHFTSYEVEATHVTSYGNADLSLVDTVTIHEMIRGFSVASDGQGLTRRGYLVNDIVDADDLPDAVYFTDATQQPLYIATGTVERLGNSEFKLRTTPKQAGWNYGSVADPTGGRQKLVKIVRQSDGAELPVDNVWQTDRTLRDGRDWLYENRLHFVGNIPAQGETFVLTFEPRPAVELAVKDYMGVPKEGTLLTTPLKEVTVLFNKDIDAATFTTDDITLHCQGTKLDASAIQIVPQTADTYLLGLEPLTQANGYYVLTVQTAGIVDYEGFYGATGKQVSWVQWLDGEQSIKEVTAEALHVSLSPLPLGEWLYISGNFSEAKTVEIYDMRGTRRMQARHVKAGTALHTGGLPSGLYVVTVHADGQTVHRKVLKR